MIEITRENLGRFEHEAEGKFYRKLPVAVKAYQMEDDFTVETLEGIMKGNAGDFMIIGVAGEPYPCNREVFEATYVEVDDTTLW
jgi:hypothetical protein